MGFLHSLEIENFKSFKGTHFIGPFRKFTAVIGPNGSGKSNLMDAISFVLGEKTQNLRVRRLGELIHGASVNHAEVNKCRVSMTYVDDEENSTVFQRSVISSASSELRINNLVVNNVQYQTALEEINIFIKAKNFLVYQGAVEMVAMQKPLDMTTISSEFQAEYDRLKIEMQGAEETAHINMNKRRDVAFEKREARLEKDEARKYQTTKKDLDNKHKELFLVQLYFVEHSRDNAKKQLAELREEVQGARAAKDEYEKRVLELTTKYKQLNRELTHSEHKITKAEQRVASHEPHCIQFKQKIDHLLAKREAVEKFHKNAKKVAEEYDKVVKEAEDKIKQVKRSLEELDAKIFKENEKGAELNFNMDQVNEYLKLKEEADRKSATFITDLDNIRQEEATCKNALVYDKSQLENLNGKIKRITEEIEREKRNIVNLKESEQNLQKLVETEKSNMQTLEKECKEAKERFATATSELAALDKQISDAHGDAAETERTRKQNEAVEKLKRTFQDRVYGRIVDLCQPSHKKYQIAVTKVINKYMTAIVCDTDETAAECINYLREQRFMKETFLPLNVIDVMPINEKLRNINDTPNVKLLFDVINCSIPNVRKAIQFVTGNSLVCDTPENARTLAYGSSERSDRYRAIALDGTQFLPSGTISGGGHDLKVRAKRWDEQHIKVLKDNRVKLYDECNRLHRSKKRELDVEIKRDQISQMEMRIKSNIVEYRKIENYTLGRLERELEANQGELEIIQHKIENRGAELEQYQKKIKKMEVERNKITDQIYSGFCARVGISDIREYEQHQMRIHDEYKNQRSEIERELEKWKYELDFLRSEDKKEAVKKELKKLEGLKAEQKIAEAEYEIQKEKLETLQENVRKLQQEVQTKRVEVEAAEADVRSVRKENAGIDKQLSSVEKSLLQHQQIESVRAAKRHSLLHECKLQGIDIPLISGNLDMVLFNNGGECSVVDDSQNSASTMQPSTAHASQTQLTINAADEIEVDYKSLLYPEKTLRNETEVNKLVEKLTKQVQETEAILSKMTAPSIRIKERMDIVKGKEAETSEECEIARKKAKKAQLAFEKVKAQRLKAFQEFFEPVSNKIDEIYKCLSQNQSAQAFLGPVNMEEPYLDGMTYNCIAPGKRFRPMDNLSGGEKTIAALALLFAIHSSNPSPFFVLDEIDAALDNTNIGKVVNYINERSRSDIQLIVISLKEELYNKSNALVGIYPKSTVPCIASGILTYDLEEVFDAVED